MAFEDYRPPRYHARLPKVDSQTIRECWPCSECGFALVPGDRVACNRGMWAHEVCPRPPLVPSANSEALLGAYLAPEAMHCPRCDAQIMRRQKVFDPRSGITVHWRCAAPLPQPPPAAMPDRW